MKRSKTEVNGKEINTMTYTELLVETKDTPTVELAAEQTETMLSEPYDTLPDQLTNGERIRNEFNVLWDLYSDRRDVMKIPHGRRTYVDEVIGTRYFDKRAIEEVYWRTTVEGPGLRDGRIQEVYILINADDKEYQIYVDEVGCTTVLKRRDGSAKWEPTSEEEATNCLDEFYHRTSDAAYIHNRRNAEEKKVANEAARELLHKRFPILGLKPAYEE